MTDTMQPGRRRFLRMAAAASTGALVGCDALSKREGFVDVLALAESLSQRVQRFLTGDRLVREYPASMI